MDSSAKSRHILLYGPPAVGKFTTANRIADRYGYRVLDNHAAIDPALRLFGFQDSGLPSLVQSIRELLFEADARSAIDVVSTYVYAHDQDQPNLDRLIHLSERHGAQVLVVQLLATRSTLEDRVADTSRAGTRKIQHLETLAHMLDQYDLMTPFPGTHLIIDNTDMTSVAVAEAIAQAFQLGRTIS